MSYSLNEIETLCRKATRGAGYSWGLAEDAGRAVRWLEAHGCLGAQTLASLLEDTDGADPADMTPRIGTIWQAEAPLCPLITGAALADFAAQLSGGPITLGKTRYPLLLVPFAAMAAGQGWLMLRWNGARVIVGAGGTLADGALGLADVDEILISQDDGPALPRPTQNRCSLTPDIHARLNAFAARTYAPATEASRIAGAGAGLTDND